MAGKRSPWGNKPPEGGDGEGPGDGGPDGTPGSEPGGEAGGEPPRGPRNPWLPDGNDGGEPRRSASIEDIFRTRGPEGPRRKGSGGGPPRGPNFRLPQRPDGKSWFPVILAGVAVVWLGLSSMHQLGPKEQGTVTTLGRYSHTIGPGISLTMPWPLQTVNVTDVTSIRRETIPEGEAEKLMLTGDQNLVDLSYLIRWNIKNLKLYELQLAEPDETLREVAEAAMRASVAEQSLNRVLSGAGRADIEQRVRDRMQAILNAYKSGIAIQGIDIKKTDPPARVVDAFKGVSAAQQDAETEINRAQAEAQQIRARAQGDAAAFDKVYEQYRLAPDVTRRRMYYETMERVLSKTDKTIVEGGNGVVPYLPLPEVKRGTTKKEGE